MHSMQRLSNTGGDCRCQHGCMAAFCPHNMQTMVLDMAMRWNALGHAMPACAAAVGEGCSSPAAAADDLLAC